MYVVRCADGSLYTGYTTEVARRLAEHNEGKGAKYTRGRGPVELVYLEEGTDRSWGQAREEAIKRLSRGAKERLIREAQMAGERPNPNTAADRIRFDGRSAAATGGDSDGGGPRAGATKL